MSRKSDHDQPTKKRHGAASKTLVWLVMGMLVVGLGGFGVTNFGSSLSAIGSVGKEEITVNEYALALQQEIRALSQQTGQNLTLQQAESMSQIVFGQRISERVLGRLYATAALDAETGRVGISVGDEEVQQQVVENPAFQGLSGAFDRETYRFALRQNGLSEREFENSIREDLSRTILQGAVSGGISGGDTLANTLISFTGEQRSFSWAKVTADAFQITPTDPTEDQLNAFYDANPELFTSPEIKKITYAWLTPNMLVDSIEIDDEVLQNVYQERIEDYRVPERRLIERLIFESDDAAAAAHARLVADELSFNALVAERGLTLSDIDLGDVSAADLGSAAQAVFGLETPGEYTAPQQSNLGPAIFRMNGILNARETSFDDARPELLSEYAIDRAKRVIEDQIQNIEDLFAEGATLEEVAAETDMEIGQIDWSLDAEDGIAGYEAFRRTAVQVTEDDFAEVLELEDGGIFGLRLNEIVPPALQPLETVRADVIDNWTNVEIQRLLNEKASELAEQIQNGSSFADLGLEEQTETDLIRTAFVEETPPSFMTDVFEMDLEEARSVPSQNVSLVVKLTAISAADLSTAENTSTAQAVKESVGQAIAQDLLVAFIQALQLDARISRDQAAINAIHTQFP